MFTETMQDRLFMWEAAAGLFLLGLLWINGHPAHGSIWGLKFRVALKSESNWRVFHRRVGWLLIAQAIWLLIPFKNADWTGLFQLPALLFGSMIIVWLIKRDLESTG